MKILKFGGTSLGTPQSIKQVKKIAKKNSVRTFVVVSAFRGMTDLLIKTAQKAKLRNTSYLDLLKKIEQKHLNCIKELFSIDIQSKIIAEVKFRINQLESLLEGIYLIEEITNKTSDKLLSFGELLSAYIIAEYFKYENLDCEYKDSRELIKTDSSYSSAKVDFEKTNQYIQIYFNSTVHKITLLPGCIGSDSENLTTRLGKGGSDYSSSIYAAALSCDFLEIWTDVSGIFTTNPKLASNARIMREISYEEALELSHFGAKVLYPSTIFPLLNKKIPIYIKNTFSPYEQGTLIVKKTKPRHQVVRGITNIDSISLIALEGEGIIGLSGIAKRVFESLSNYSINVILITQASSSEHSICIAVQSDQSELAKSVIDKNFEDEIKKDILHPVTIESELSIVAVVGDNMKNHQGLSGKIFSTLGNNNINIRAIAQGSSEKNISAVINTKDVKKAITSLHERFFEDKAKQLNLFVTGVGNVGKKFIEQIIKQRKYLNERLKLNIRIIGISNSKNMIFNENGIDLNHYEDELNQGESANFNQFFNRVRLLNLRNSIFIDNTANYGISTTYENYLSNNIAIVTCNKIACSSDFKNYSKLKNISQEYLVPFLFETNVGAGLPIIDTLKNLIASGDVIHKIQAVLSGSLNFIFNNFNDSTTFYEVVNQAKKEGYTEPDPRIDLSGVDVMRKILILARESGYKIDIDEIENRAFLPEECIKTQSIEDFMESLKTYESHFQNLYQSTQFKGYKLKYVAHFENGKAKVGIQEIASNHSFYNLEGKDNIVLFFTERYHDQPLIIKGAGAGAEVTASGIFADVIRIGRI